MSNKSSILFAENINFHERNFKSLFDYIKSEKVIHAFMQPDKAMLSAFGNYYTFSDKLLKYKYTLDGLCEEELLNFQYQNINIFDVCKSELMCYLMPQHNWRSVEILNNNNFIIKKAFKENKEDLLWNMSAVIYWIDFLTEEIKKYKIHDYCCVFSGSIIYSRVLLELLKTHPTKPLVMESFFTGNEYYMEFKYDSLPNNTDLRHKNIFQSYKLPEVRYEYDKLKAKTINKILNANNKNVKQPNKDHSLIQKLPNNYILICGQVINDFSILNTQKKINSLQTYKDVILGILKNTQYSIVFKAHPWEEHKSNVRCPLTFNELKKWTDELPDELASRLCIENNINLDDLILNSKAFLTICSQSALEAAFKGYKPIILGKAFYDNFGFTSNFETVGMLTDALKNKKLSFKLSLQEYKNFEEFMMVALNHHLICVFNSGVPQLRQRFSKKSYIAIEKKDEYDSIVEDNSSIVVQKSEEVVSTPIVQHILEADKIVNEIRQVASDSSKKNQQILSQVEQKIEDLVKTQERSISIQKNSSLVEVQHKIQERVLQVEDSAVKLIGSNKLYEKYKHDRDNFFKDVKNPVVLKYWQKIGKKIL